MSACYPVEPVTAREPRQNRLSFLGLFDLSSKGPHQNRAIFSGTLSGRSRKPVSSVFELSERFL